MESQNSHLPDSNSPNLHLIHPTQKELQQIWYSTFPEWGDALTLPDYLQESAFLTFTPLKPTMWILTLKPDQRPILSSCETFRKRCLTGTKGEVKEKIVYGIASVFCKPKYRGRGFASRMMKELRMILRNRDDGECIGSVLYSDIGRSYYSKLGWRAVPNNNHLEFPPSKVEENSGARQLQNGDLAQLCEEDERLIQKSMTLRTTERKWFLAISDEKHLLWHHRKEEFVCGKLFGRVLRVKGAISGSLIGYGQFGHTGFMKIGNRKQMQILCISYDLWLRIWKPAARMNGCKYNR